MKEGEYCASCGAQNPSDARFCFKCGKPFESPSGTNPPAPTPSSYKPIGPQDQKPPKQAAKRRLKKWHIVAISCLAAILIVVAGFSVMLTARSASEFQTGIPVMSAVSTMTKNGPAVLLINQNGCPPCDTIKPRFADLAAQYKDRGVTFATFDIDDNRTSYNVAVTYNVSATPTAVVVLPDGAFASFVAPPGSCSGKSDPKCGEVDLNQVRGALDNVLQGNVREVKAASSLVDRASKIQTTAQNSDLSSYFSQTYFGGSKFIVERNFTKSVNYRGNDVYTGVVRRTDRPMSAGFTAVIELVKTQTDAKKLFNSSVARAQGEGYSYRADWVAQMQNEPGMGKTDEMWSGSSAYGQQTIYYHYDYTANSWLVVTETG